MTGRRRVRALLRAIDLTTAAAGYIVWVPTRAGRWVRRTVRHLTRGERCPLCLDWTRHLGAHLYVDHAGDAPNLRRIT